MYVSNKLQCESERWLESASIVYELHNKWKTEWMSRDTKWWVTTKMEMKGLNGDMRLLSYPIWCIMIPCGVASKHCFDLLPLFLEPYDSGSTEVINNTVSGSKENDKSNDWSDSDNDSRHGFIRVLPYVVCSFISLLVLIGLSII